jgi:hypothetical protein
MGRLLASSTSRGAYTLQPYYYSTALGRPGEAPRARARRARRGAGGRVKRDIRRGAGLRDGVAATAAAAGNAASAFDGGQLAVRQQRY